MCFVESISDFVFSTFQSVNVPAEEELLDTVHRKDEEQVLNIHVSSFLRVLVCVWFNTVYVTQAKALNTHQSHE